MKKYFITFIDDCTRYCYVYFLNGKNEEIDMFRQYKIKVENQLDKKIKMIKSDRGGEYESYLKNKIVHKNTTSYAPQSNEIGKKKSNIEGNNECLTHKF